MSLYPIEAPPPDYVLQCDSYGCTAVPHPDLIGQDIVPIVTAALIAGWGFFRNPKPGPNFGDALAYCPACLPTADEVKK